MHHGLVSRRGSRTTKTGQGAWRVTRSAVPPSRKRPNTEVALAPTTIRSGAIASASFRIFLERNADAHIRRARDAGVPKGFPQGFQTLARPLLVSVEPGLDLS